jgi:prepilin-type N-terminal cleavage/methylation domain-containing protein
MNKLYRHQGFTLLELLVSLSVLGIMMSLGAMNMRNDRTAVIMAAQSISTEIVRTRFEAIRQNTWVGYALTATGTTIFIDEDRNLAFNDKDTVINKATFKSSEHLKGVRVQSGANGVIVFDPRGLPRTPAFNFALMNMAGEIVKTLKINGQGRVSAE